MESKNSTEGALSSAALNIDRIRSSDSPEVPPISSGPAACENVHTIINIYVQVIRRHMMELFKHQ
jgi:hypothetical protein